MSTNIVCPKCGNEFEPTEALAQSIRDEITKEFRQKWIAEQSKKEEQFKQKERELAQQQQLLEQRAQQQDVVVKQQLEQEKKKMEATLSQQLSQNIKNDYDARLTLLAETQKRNEDKLAEARTMELNFRRQLQDLQQKEQEQALALEKAILEERAKAIDLVRKEEEERGKMRDSAHNMKIMELEKQLDDQRKLAEEMRRKAEQGSMQLQGEIQELALEALLRNTFPYDTVQEVGKGVRGADCIQTIRNSYGQECGKIIYESKRTKDFSIDWIEKLKADSRSLGADVAVIVTQAMPKDMECFGEKDGIWVCSFTEVRALVSVLRDLVIKVFLASKNNENKGDKMTLLYNYLISTEFSGQWNAIREGFMVMKMSIQKERDQMERLWKAREKQLEKVLLNATHIKGSIEGISGMDSIDLTLGDDSGYLLE